MGDERGARGERPLPRRGHYATERLGCARSASTCGRSFGVEVEFIDVPNPV